MTGQLSSAAPVGAIAPEAAARLIAARAGGRALALFLDFDGTLAPIVEQPEDARLDPILVPVLAKLAARGPVTVVTGRSLADVRDLVPVPGIMLAGSHGYEIAAPGVPPAPVAAAEPAIRVSRAAARLERLVTAIPGARVEPKTFAVAVHWRHVEPARVGEILAIVDEVGRDIGDLVLTRGKRVFELRPALAWDKGAAVRWIRDALGLGPATHLAIFAGDDVTDLDGLAAVRADGLGIVVGSAIVAEPGELRLTDPAALGRLLAQLCITPAG